MDASIVGMGLTEQGRHLGVSGRELRRQALDLALADAGLGRSEIDGYIMVGASFEDLRYLGLSPGFSYSLMTGGTSPTASVLVAAGAIATGQATTVACLYGEAYSSPHKKLSPHTENGTERDIRAYSYGYPYLYGMVGPAATYALAARRHMELYGTTSEDLGRVAVVEREYASTRPGAQGYKQPITLDDHQGSRMIVDPLRLLDCSRPTDGGAAVIVTSTERAADITDRAVSVLGGGTSHAIETWWNGTMFESMNVGRAARTALGQAGVDLEDIDTAQLYAPFTIAVLMQLEEYGFCAPGEGGEFVAAGHTGPNGSIPTNTGGGQLSGFYATGFTPLSEGILQMRGQAPSSQIDDPKTCLVSGSGGNGGVQGSWSHASLVLGATR
ncbi:thiolase family protein [Rhodococcus sp. P1Y]|uniref:thiolase family protein n=1 Tax=Rhodococcus sp. P1Y TaxID=1302308 RepID=UPI001F446E13|nr:thiolase family protein [Rhodococcus sp. P1Y]